MFMGEYSHNLDAKGRIIIPAKFRDELSSTFILTRGLDGCLAIRTLEQWNKMIEDISLLPSTKKNTREYIRMLTANAVECTLDNQGRIQIPSFLSEPVGIKKECKIIGVNTQVEIWDKDRWLEYSKTASNNFEDIAENLYD